MLYLINLKGRIPLLFYCVKDIHGQFNESKAKSVINTLF